MAKVQKRVAAKDYPKQNIAKGDTYYYVQLKTGPRSSKTMRSKTPFRRSQLTTSDYLSQLYDWEDSLQSASDIDAVRQLAEDIRNLGEEQQGKFDNLPEGFQQGATGELIQERASACESAADTLDEIVSEWEDAESTWDSEIETYKTEREEYLAAKKKYDEASDPDEDEDDAAEEPEEPTEPELPEHTRDWDEDSVDSLEFDPDEFLDRARETSVE